jgi:hypothetical protein
MDSAQRETLARLAQSRAEICSLLDPPPPSDRANESGATATGAFPRSRTMRLLMSGRGLGTVGALAGGLLLARPALALRLLVCSSSRRLPHSGQDMIERAVRFSPT